MEILWINKKENVQTDVIFSVFKGLSSFKTMHWKRIRLFFQSRAKPSFGLALMPYKNKGVGELPSEIDPFFVTRMPTAILLRDSQVLSAVKLIFHELSWGLSKGWFHLFLENVASTRHWQNLLQFTENFVSFLAITILHCFNYSSE